MDRTTDSVQELVVYLVPIEIAPGLPPERRYRLTPGVDADAIAVGRVSSPLPMRVEIRDGDEVVIVGSHGLATFEAGTGNYSIGALLRAAVAGRFGLAWLPPIDQPTAPPAPGAHVRWPLTPAGLAALFGCSPNAIAKAADAGAIGCYRLPDSQHRRFSRKHVVDYIAGRPEPERSTLMERLACWYSPDTTTNES